MSGEPAGVDRAKVRFSLRFDFRNPAFAGVHMADRYAAALDMAQWADENGCANIVVSEHHGAKDGYLPSPAVMLAAMAARTRSIRFSIGALIAPFHDPLRIAEDLCVLDNLARGRLDIVVAGGYAHEEFEMFGIELRERPKRVTETVETLRAAFSGQPFSYRGRNVQVTPPSNRPGRPLVLMGGASEPAARRAARIGDGFVPSTPDVWEFYRDEVIALGRADPGPCPFPIVKVTALADDAEAGWRELASYFLYETNAYGQWQAQDDISSPYRTRSGTEELRAAGNYEVLSPDALIAQLRAMPIASVSFHPMCGGIPPAKAWESLKLFEREVLPAFR